MAVPAGVRVSPPEETLVASGVSASGPLEATNVQEALESLATSLDNVALDAGAATQAASGAQTDATQALADAAAAQVTANQAIADASAAQASAEAALSGLLYSGTTSGAGTYSETFPAAFSTTPNVAAQIIGGTPNHTVVVTSRSMTGFTVTTYLRSTVNILGNEVLLGSTAVVNGIDVDVSVFSDE